MLRALVLTIMLLVLFSAGNTAVAQPGDQYCEKPQYSPRKERHYNCRDALGRRQGVWKSYSYYGFLLSEVSYKDNKINGPVIIYYSTTGKVRERSSYFDGKRDGEYTTYFFSGQTNAEGEYDYGKKVGTWTYYYNTSGETRMTGSYTNGKRDGEWKYYNSKGILIKTVTFKYGEVLSTVVPPQPGAPGGTTTLPK